MLNLMRQTYNFMVNGRLARLDNFLQLLTAGQICFEIVTWSFNTESKQNHKTSAQTSVLAPS